MASPTMRYQKAASALRANLKRRKAQVRARSETQINNSLQLRSDGKAHINTETNASIVDTEQDVVPARK